MTKLPKFFPTIHCQIGKYFSSNPDGDAAEYLDDQCLQQSAAGYVWTDLELTVPEWLQSNWYGMISYIGISLSVIEFILFFYLSLLFY